jgi:prefoldin subunit 4
VEALGSRTMCRFWLFSFYRYKVGDCFFSLPVEDVQQLLEQSTAKIDGEVDGLEQSLKGLREEMGELKVLLYGRFGRSINLEL